VAYSFAVVEKALARLNHIAPSKRSAFANRLKHLQRKGFPPGVNTGRGRAADYQPEHVVLLALALELITFGYTPEKAIGAMEESLGSIAEGIYRATDFKETILCSFQPNGLGDLQDKIKFQKGDPPLQWLSAEKAMEGMIALTLVQSAGSRVALFSLSGVISLCNSLINWEGNDDDKECEFFDSLIAWAKGIMDGDS